MTSAQAAFQFGPKRTFYKEKPVVAQSDPSRDIVFRDNEFRLRVYGNGEVNGKFCLSNNNKDHGKTFTVDFAFYADDKNTSFLTKGTFGPVFITDDSTNVFNYDFKIGENNAKQVKGFKISVQSKIDYNSDGLNWLADHKKTLAIVVVSVVVVLLLVVKASIKSKTDQQDATVPAQAKTLTLSEQEENEDDKDSFHIGRINKVSDRL